MIDKKKRIVFIDLDGTLIKTISGGTFPICIADQTPIWSTWNSLKSWAKSREYEKSYLFIVTNQGGIQSNKGSREEYIVEKLNYIKACLQEYLDVDKKYVIVDYAYCKSNSHLDPKRKPNTGMLHELLLINNLTNISKDEMVMIGDATDKSRDFSDSDRKVAENFKIEYVDYRDL